MQTSPGTRLVHTYFSRAVVRVVADKGGQSDFGRAKLAFTTIPKDGPQCSAKIGSAGCAID
jgi:hypothetical protein